jgi:F0F1-type ATP synthase alpha subunit
MLKQGQFQPMTIERQVVVVYAATKGYLDKLNVSDISSFEQTLLKQIDPEILSSIAKEKTISESLNKRLQDFFDGFTAKFLAARV